MSKVLQESGNYPTVLPGEYTAQVLEVSEGQNKFYPTYDDGQPRIDVTFKFVIEDDEEFDGSYVWGRTTPTFTTNPECKLRRWVLAILGLDEIEPGFILEYSDLVSKQVRVWVKHSSTGKPRVDEVLPLSNRRAAGATPAPAPAAAAASAPAPAAQAQQPVLAGAVNSSAATGADDFGEEPF